MKKLFQDIYIYLHKILTILLNLFVLGLGFFICGYIFYIRILMDRIPKELSFSWNIYLFTMYISLFLLYGYILLKKYSTPKTTKNKLIIWLKETILLNVIKVYEKSLMSVYNLLIDQGKIPFIRQIIYESIYYIRKFCESSFMSKQIYQVILYYLIILLPRLIVVIAFFIDVLVFNEMYYMYKIIWILIIPLIWKVYYYLLEHLCRHFTCITLMYFDVLVKKDEINKQTLIYCTEIKDCLFRRDFPISKEQANQMKKDIINLHIVKEQFLDVFSTEGPIASAPFYKKITTIILILYTIIWGYMVYNMAILIL